MKTREFFSKSFNAFERHKITFDHAFSTVQTVTVAIRNVAFLFCHVA